MATPTYTHFDADYLPFPFGLDNTGIICWLNSIIQSLLSCTALNKIILEVKDELNNRFAREYARLVYFTVEVAKSSDWNPDSVRRASSELQRAFAECVRAKYSRTIGYQQECVDEAFTMMIDLFDHPRIASLFSNNYELQICCPFCKEMVSAVRDKTYKIEVFTQQPIADARAFNDYLRIHQSPMDHYECPKCKLTSTPNRIERLTMLREIVTLVFNKYGTKYGSSESRFFPPELKFQAKGGGWLMYRQVAQIEHVGSLHGGHYYADVIRSLPGTDNKLDFYRVNDSSAVPNRPMPTTNTYMAFYHLVSSP